MFGFLRRIRNCIHITDVQICLVQICYKYELCKAFAPSASAVMAKFARFCATSAIATFALVAKLCEFHICNIFAPGKFGANSIFRSVIYSPGLHTRKNAQVVTSLQTSCNKSDYKLSTSCVRTACSQFVVTSLEQAV